MKRTMMAVVAAVALVAAPALAQGQQGARADSTPGMGSMRGQSGMMQGAMSGGMMGMADGPEIVLRLKTLLDLTDSQVTQLETLRDSASSTMRQHMMQGMQVVQSASKLLAGDSPDLDAYEAQLREAAKHIILAHTAMARAVVDARRLLTAQQRERLAFAREVMQAMGGGMMNGSPMSRSGNDGSGI